MEVEDEDTLDKQVAAMQHKLLTDMPQLKHIEIEIYDWEKRINHPGGEIDDLHFSSSRNYAQIKVLLAMLRVKSERSEMKVIVYESQNGGEYFRGRLQEKIAAHPNIRKSKTIWK